MKDPLSPRNLGLNPREMHWAGPDDKATLARIIRNVVAAYKRSDPQVRVFL